MPISCAGKRLTWEELRKLPDHTLVYTRVSGVEEPYPCVLRWDGETACFCAINPETGNDVLVARREEAKFKSRRCEVWLRVEVPTSDEIVASEPQMTRPADAGFWGWPPKGSSDD